MYIKRKHQDLVDEMFQFPKGKNDDLLDGIWYALIHARAPLSRKFESDEFDNYIEKKQKRMSAKSVISWVTGQKL
jgi:hypothetical protein